MKILKVTNHKDGTATIDYELNQQELKMIKEIAGVKRLTNKKINEIILKILTERLKKEIKKSLKSRKSEPVWKGNSTKKKIK